MDININAVGFVDIPEEYVDDDEIKDAVSTIIDIEAAMFQRNVEMRVETVVNKIIDEREGEDGSNMLLS